MVSRDDRGASTVVGFILVFAILTITFSIYQGVIIPEQNKGVEFDHNQKVQGQMLSLQDAIRRTGTSGVGQTVSIQVAAEFPDRTLGVNFAASGGRITTVEPGNGNIVFENVTATDSDVADYFNRTMTFSTKDIRYRPAYTRYSNAPETIYSNTAVFNQFDAVNVSRADQILIQGNRITLIAINGTLDEGLSGDGASVSIGTEPLSAATNSIAITNNESARNITLTVPTSVANRSVWDGSSLAEQDNASITSKGDSVTITLNRGTYSLRMANVGVGSGTVDQGAEYLTLVDRPGRTILNDSSQFIEVEVRDRFNNPVTGRSVTAIANNTDGPDGEFGNSATNRTLESSASGRVRFNYTAPNVDGAKIELTFRLSSNPTPEERVRFNVTVRTV